MLDVVEWFKVGNVEALPALENKLREIQPYAHFTEGKRDKNDKPIVFVGNKPQGSNRVNAHLAVWFKSEELERAGMQLIAMGARRG